MARPDQLIIDTDVLVVGGGCAGCWAAIRARDFTSQVTLVDKATVARSGSTVYCHDMLAPLPEGQLGPWLEDIVEHADYMSDQRYAEMVLREEGERVRQLVSWGVPFERDAKGELLLSFGRGHKNSRVLLYDGRVLMEVMRKEVLHRGIPLLERVMVTDLLTSDGHHPTREQVIGAVGLHTRTGQLVVLKAKAVVLATGMLTAKLRLHLADNLTGDARAMAFRAGAELAGLEFTFNPTFTAWHKGVALAGPGVIQFQTQGAYIVNSQGERFMEEYAPDRKERRSTKGFLGLAVTKEILEGRGPVYFDMRHFDAEKFEQVKRILPITMTGLEVMGIDPARDLIECRPVVASFGTGRNGGIRINRDGQSSLPGLVAAGVTLQFPGGSELPSGVTMAFCNVSGYRAGEQAASIAAEQGTSEVVQEQVLGLKDNIFSPMTRKPGVSPHQIYRRLNNKLVRPEYSLIKSEATIIDMLREIREVAREELPRVVARDIHELIKANEVANYVLLLELIYTSALERKESRLCHYRLDFPFRDDIDWLKWIVLRKEDSGIKISYQPVPVESNRIKLATHERIPSPLQFSPSR